MSATLRLKYLAPHHPHLSAGTVRVQAEDTIFEVIELICKSYPNLSAANTNDLYKCSNFFLEPTDNRHERALAVLAAGKFERLNELHTVGKHFSANADRSEQLDVVIVPRASFRDGIHTLAASEYDRYKKYHETFIKVSKHDKFEEGDVQLNGIQECPPERVPEFVANFKDLLTKQAIISTECQFPGTPDGVYLSEDEDSQHSVSQQEGHYRLAGETEAAHIQWLRSLDWERLWRSPNLKGALENALKEDAFHALYSFGAMLDLPEDTKLTIMRKTQSWPFMLIITSAEHDATSRLEERYRTYRPKSDFSIWSSGLPRLLVEVNSTQPRNGLMPFDQVRLLLAGASVVRFANRGVAEYNQEKKFVLVCVYVEDNGTTVRYLLFQNSKDSAVYYTKDTFLVSKSQDRVIFARDLHNLSYMLGRSPEDNDTKMKVSEFTQDVWTAKRYYNLPSAHSRITKSKNKRRRPNEDDHEDNNGGGTRGESAHADEDKGALLRSIGYGVEPDIHVDESGGEWGSLVEYPAHILSVYKLSDRRMRFIAKKVRKGSDELKILQLLKTTKPTCDHVIHLYDWVSSPSESWIILPEMTPIANYLSTKLHPYTARVCSGLIYGLAYLHRLSIAHCDIKPANIVVDRYFCPKIIDFDCAIQLKDEDEEVVGSCGTEGWTAPEVSDSSLYSPLRADRWSSGHVILYLLNKAKTDGGRLRAFALKLEAIDPRQRPSLADWPVLEPAPVTEPVQTIRPHSVLPEPVENPVAKKRKTRTQHIDPHPNICTTSFGRSIADEHEYREMPRSDELTRTSQI